MKFSLREKTVGVFAAVCFVLLAVAATLPQPVYVGAFVGDGSSLSNLISQVGSVNYSTNYYISNQFLVVNDVSNYQAITVETNVTFNQNINVKGNATLNTAIYNTIGAITNVWGGPTNTIAFGPSDYVYSSFTACQITGFTGLTSTNTGNAVLTLFNLAATNWVLTFPTQVYTPTGVRSSLTVTNGQEQVVWFRYHPGSGHTNMVNSPNY